MKITLDESLFSDYENPINESYDGWDDEVILDIDGADVLEEIEDLIYEIKNTYRGANTNCETYEQLGQYIKDLAETLSYFGDNIMTLKDEDEEVEE